jgi:phosphoglycolate phosphatase-like HAD superfamily hydrolase
VRAAVVDLDTVLGDTRPLWSAWLDELARRARVELDIPADRAAAVPELDRAVGNWRALLGRFAEDHAAIHLRPHPEVNAALRSLNEDGIRVGAFTDAPAELAHVALAHLGVARRLEAVEAGADALERLLERFGPDTTVVRTREELQELRGAA